MEARQHGDLTAGTLLTPVAGVLTSVFVVVSVLDDQNPPSLGDAPSNAPSKMLLPDASGGVVPSQYGTKSSLKVSKSFDAQQCRYEV